MTQWEKCKEQLEAKGFQFFPLYGMDTTRGWLEMFQVEHEKGQHNHLFNILVWNELITEAHYKDNKKLGFQIYICPKGATFDTIEEALMQRMGEESNISLEEYQQAGESLYNWNYPSIKKDMEAIRKGAERKLQCGNCDWEGLQSQLKSIKDRNTDNIIEVCPECMELEHLLDLRITVRDIKQDLSDLGLKLVRI